MKVVVPYIVSFISIDSAISSMRFRLKPHRNSNYGPMVPCFCNSKINAYVQERHSKYKTVNLFFHSGRIQISFLNQIFKNILRRRRTICCNLLVPRTNISRLWLLFSSHFSANISGHSLASRRAKKGRKKGCIINSKTKQ